MTDPPHAVPAHASCRSSAAPRPGVRAAAASTARLRRVTSGRRVASGALHRRHRRGRPVAARGTSPAAPPTSSSCSKRWAAASRSSTTTTTAGSTSSSSTAPASRPPCGATPTSYLFHNNRDGTFTDVTQKAGLTAFRLGSGLLRRRLRQRRLRRSVRQLLGPQRPVSQQRRRHVHRRVRESRRRRAADSAGAPAAASSTTIATAISICSSPATSTSIRRRRRAPAAAALLPLQRHPRALRSARIRRRHQHPLSQPRRRHVRRRLRSVGNRAVRAAPSSMVVRAAAAGGRPAPTAWAPRRPTSTTTAGPTSTSPATRAPSLLYRNNHDGTFREIAVPAGCALRRERRRARRHGRRRRRLRWRRLARHRAHQLLRAGDHALSQLWRRLSGREPQRPASA